MDSKNERIYSKENYLANGYNTKSQYSKNQIVHTIQEPALNESGIEAKQKGFQLYNGVVAITIKFREQEPF